MDSAPREVSRERALASALVGGLLVRERRTARALVAAERFALRSVRAAVDGVVARAALTEPSDVRDAMVAVRRTVPAVRSALESAILESRAHARRAGRETLGRGARRIPGEEEDAAASHNTAGSYAAAWGALVLAILLGGGRRDSGAESSPPPFARAFSPKPLDHRLRRIAATETARAFNDERIGVLREQHAPEAGIFKVWSAILDRRTCDECFDRDGQTVELHASFGVPLPLHVCCRCIAEILVVPHPQRLEDIAIDYEIFKREMRDVVRERHVESERHAGDFVRDSMGRHRSPVVLTRKFGALAH